MLKNKIKNTDLSSIQSGNEFIDNCLSIMNTNPLTYYEPNDNSKVKEFVQLQYDTVRALYSSYSIDDIIYYLHNNKIDALRDAQGNLCLNPVTTITKAGNVIEILTQSNKSEGPGIVKINKNQYINTKRPLLNWSDNMDTTTYYKYNDQWYKKENYSCHSEKSPNELRKTFRRLTNIINSNTTNPKNCLWVTLTYKDNISGPEGNEKLYKDFKVGIQRLRRKYGHFEYISVVEPQGRGAWHCHCIFIFDKKIYIPNKEIAAAWGQGFTKTKKMDSNVDNLGSYLTAYLCDIPMDDIQSFDFNTGVEVLENCKIETKQGKKFIKGGRLYLYPPYMKIYRTSRGIIQPDIISDASEDDISEAVGNLPLLYETTYELKLEDEDSNYSNIIRYRQYNKTVQTEYQKDQRQKKLKK